MTPQANPRRWLGAEAGFAPAEFVVFVGLILLPTVILVASLPTWWERHSLAQLAAQEAARTLALADTWETGVTAGEQIAAMIAANHDVPADDLTVAFGGALERGQPVSATVTVDVPATTVPFLAALPRFTMTITHTELVDVYRSIPRP